MERVALVIGGSSGIGLATAEILAENGYIVYNGSRRVCPCLNVKSEFLDVADSDSIAAFIQKILDRHNSIDILVYNSGFSMASPIEKVKSSDYRYLYDVNFFGAIEAIKAVTPVMKKNGCGRIILISSIGSVFPIAYDPYYCASKASLDTLAKTLHPELSSYNIRITSLLVGGTRTAFSYKRKVEEEGRCDKRMNNSVKVLCRIEQKGMTAKAVARKVFRLSQRFSPPIITAPGFKNKLIMFAVKFMPRKLISFICGRIFYKNIIN